MNKDFDKNAFAIASLFNLIAVDIDEDGTPDAIAICNPDGSKIGEGEQPESVNSDIDKDKFSFGEIVNNIAVDLDDDNNPDAIGIYFVK